MWPGYIKNTYDLLAALIGAKTGAASISVVPASDATFGTAGAFLDATATGGTAKAIMRGGAKGTTLAADVTSNPVDANTQAAHTAEALAPAAEDNTGKVIRVEARHSYTYKSGAQTALTIAGAIYLQRVVINTPAASGSVSIYDTTSNGTGTPVAIMTLPASLVSDGPISVEYNILLNTGLTYAVVGAGMDVTLVWRAAAPT